MRREELDPEPETSEQDWEWFDEVVRRCRAYGRVKRMAEICRNTRALGDPRRISDDALKELLWALIESLGDQDFEVPGSLRLQIATELERALRSGRLLGGGRRGPHRYETLKEETKRRMNVYYVFYSRRESGESYSDASESTAEFLKSFGWQIEAKTVRDTIAECNREIGPRDAFAPLQRRLDVLTWNWMERQKQERWKGDPPFATHPDYL